jgi:hypothetical protein
MGGSHNHPYKSNKIQKASKCLFGPGSSSNYVVTKKDMNSDEENEEG